LAKKTRRSEDVMTDVSQQLIQDRIRDLRENTDFVATLFESLIGYAIIAADFDGNIIAYNEGARQIYGYAPEEIIGQQNMEIFFPKDFVEAGKLQQVIDDLIGKGRVPFEGEKVRKGGERFPAQVLFTLTKDRSGRVVGFVEIVGDLTERKRAEEAEAQARASAERIEQLERELRSLERLSAAPSTAVPAQPLDVAPLRKSVPDAFSELVQYYGSLMDFALEQRAHKAKHDISGELRSISERLGFLRAGPRDVVEIHSNALKGKTNLATSQRAQAYVEEGRLMVLELMGYLAAFYRTYAAGVNKT
jgi:PAS domain S-box-containing protein